MKKFLFMILLIIMPFCFIGCSNGNQSTNSGTYDYKYTMKAIDVDSNGKYVIYYDKNTKVMYIQDSSKGGIAVMVNPDGSPQLYKGE